MSERFSFSLGVVFAFLIAIGSIAFAMQADAQTQCPAGTQPATNADLATMKAAGIPNPIVGMCWSSSNQYIGQATAQAKEDLTKMICGSQSANIQNLDANFAVCADKFMTSLRQSMTGACINSAYRSVAQQLAACQSICHASSCPGLCAPPGKSFHQQGLAIDVGGITNNSQAWQIATQSTGGGIANPSGLHGSDPHHFQATTASCAGAPVPSTDTTDVYTGIQTGPSQMLSPYNLQAPPGYCMTSANPIIYTPCGMNGAPTGMPQAMPVTQPMQTAQPNPAQSPATTPTVTPTTPLSTTIATSATNAVLSNLFQTTPIKLFQTSTSAAQALTIFANLGSATTASSSASLNTSLSSIINTIIAGTTGNATQTDASSSGITQQNYPQDTFIPGEQQPYASSSNAALFQVLQPLKNALTNLLSFLRSL